MKQLRKKMKTSAKSHSGGRQELRMGQQGWGDRTPGAAALGGTRTSGERSIHRIVTIRHKWS